MSTSTAGPAAGRVAWQPRTAFVLAGGAALGAMQAGMIHALYERGIAPDLLIGTSAGALNAAFLASRPATVATAEEMAAVWRGLHRSDILPLRPAWRLTWRGPAWRMLRRAAPGRGGRSRCRRRRCCAGRRRSRSSGRARGCKG